MWKQVTRDSSIVLCGSIVSNVFILLYRILVIRELSVEDYAVFALLTTIFNWLFVFSHFDVYAGLSKFVSENRTINKLLEVSNYYYNAVFLVVVLSLVGLCMGLAVSNTLSVNLYVLFVFFGGLLFFSISTVNDGFIKGYEKFKWSALIMSSSGVSRFAVFAIFMIIVSDVSLHNILILFSIALLVPLIISSIAIGKLDVFRYKYQIKNSKSTASELFHYSKWVSLTDLLNGGVILSSTYILSYFSYSDLALFNVVIVIYGIFQIGFGAITTVLIPHVSRRVSEGESIRLLGRKEIIYLFAGTACLILFFIFVPRKEAMLTYILRNQVYSGVLFYIALLLITYPFRILTMTYKGIVQGLNNPRSIAVVALATFITNLVCFVPLYLRFGILGAVISLNLAYIIEFIFSYSVAGRLIKRINYVTQGI